MTRIYDETCKGMNPYNSSQRSEELEKAAKEDDLVNNPKHYNKGGIECIDVIEVCLTPEEYRGYCKGNNIKYTFRANEKGGNKDLKKARWYMNRYQEYFERRHNLNEDA